MMQLYYFKDKHGNFGDDLNPWFWQNALDNFFDDDDHALLVGIGTLINHRAPGGRKKITLGSGVGYGNLPADLENWDFQLVRGPLSAQKLGLDEYHWITDPAVLVPSFLPLTDVKKKYAYSFLPHHGSDRVGDWQRLCNEAGLNYISPGMSPHDVFKEIKSSHILITEAMHGAIIADAYRTPWIPVKCSRHFSDFKWDDWMQSMGILATVSEIPCHYAGYTNQSFSTKFKSEVKHLLQSIGFRPAHWTPPVPRRSTNAAERKIIDKLKLCRDFPATLSDEKILADRIERFQEFLVKFAAEFGPNQTCSKR
jgi:succinoglycan biosynthesis protein ExoV